MRDNNGLAAQCVRARIALERQMRREQKRAFTPAARHLQESVLTVVRRKVYFAGKLLFFLRRSRNPVIALIRISGTARARLRLSPHQIGTQLLGKAFFLPLCLALLFLVYGFIGHVPCLHW